MAPAALGETQRELPATNFCARQFEYPLPRFAYHMCVTVRGEETRKVSTSRCDYSLVGASRLRKKERKKQRKKERKRPSPEDSETYGPRLKIESDHKEPWNT